MSLFSYLTAVVKADQKVNPLFITLGISARSITTDEAVLVLTVDGRHIQGASSLAGGVIATLLDEAMAHAVLATLLDHEQTVTASMNVTYLRPASVGQTLLARARLIKRGRELAFTDAVLACEGDEDRPVATATATFLLHRS